MKNEKIIITIIIIIVNARLRRHKSSFSRETGMGMSAWLVVIDLVVTIEIWPVMSQKIYWRILQAEKSVEWS